MGDLVNRLGNKIHGALVKSEDWNDLVTSTEAIDTNLSHRLTELGNTLTDRIQQVSDSLTSAIHEVDARVAAVQQNLTSSLQGVDARLSSLQQDLTALRNDVAPLLERSWQLTLETSRANFALGEMAEITAKVKSAKGETITTGPWIDFLAVWGRFKAAPGYQTKSGASNRNISVRADAAGVAKVLLSAEHTDGIADEAETEVATTLTTRLPNTNRTIAETVLSAATPMQAKMDGAFAVIRNEHDRKSATSVRNYVDTYFMKTPALRTPRVVPNYFHSWRDYRSTVLAFVKADDDPMTPDQARAASSTQISFRDWIGPWLSLDYFTEVSDLVVQYKDRLGSNRVITPDFQQSTANMKNEISAITQGKGLVGRQRDYLVISQAVGNLSLAQPPSFMQTLTTSVRGAVGIQKLMETTEMVSDESGQEPMVAMEAFASSASQAEKGMLEVKETLSKMQQSVGEMSGKVGTLDSGVKVLQESVTNIRDKSTQAIEDVGTVKNQVNRLGDLNVADVKDAMAKAIALWEKK